MILCHNTYKHIVIFLHLHKVCVFLYLVHGCRGHELAVKLETLDDLVTQYSQ